MKITGHHSPPLSPLTLELLLASRELHHAIGLASLLEQAAATILVHLTLQHNLDDAKR